MRYFITILIITCLITATKSQVQEEDTTSMQLLEILEASPDDSIYRLNDAENASGNIAPASDTLKPASAARQQAGLAEATAKPREALRMISFSKVFWAVIFLTVAWLLIRFIVNILNVFAERSTKARITVKSLIPVVRIIIWVVAIYIVVQGIFAPPIETLLAATASVAIAVGLAAQDLLKNVFGGIMLLFDRPFQVGDKIEAGKHYGEVVEIGLRATRIVTPDDSVVSIPNMELMNGYVSNSNSGELNCQVVAEIYLPFDIDTQKVRKIAIESAQVSKYIFLNKPIVVVFFNEIHQGKLFLKMRLKAYVMDIRYEFAFKSDMTEIVIRELLKEGILRSKTEIL
jgi:MscS family membrane protein